MSWENQTLDYYDQNTDQFISRSVNADMGEMQTRFLSCLPPGALVLDFGCGSGRDTKAFLAAGYRVEATDGSQEICAAASRYTGVPVKKLLFQELETRDRYDGIWANASILHLPKAALSDVLGRIERALKPGGVAYTSFKYGDFEGIREERYYTDFTENSLREFWQAHCTLQIFDLWVSEDHLPEKREVRWLNVLSRR